MKSIYWSLYLLLLICLTPERASADSELTLSRAFNILAVNGEKYSGGLLDQDRELKLNSGLNRIAIEYEEVFESDQNDNFDIVKSDPFLLQVYLQNNQKYKQRLVKPANAEAGRQFAKHPLFEIVTIKDGKEQKISFEISALAGSNDTYLAEQTRQSANSRIEITSEKYPSNMPSLDSNNKGQSMATKMLDYWWQQATPEEKEKFLQSINQK